MPEVAIVNRGTIVGQWTVPSCGPLMNKFTLLCKREFRGVRWGDHGVVTKRRTDPEYVAFRNTGRDRILVMIVVSRAPENWLDEIKQIYGW